MHEKDTNTQQKAAYTMGSKVLDIAQISIVRAKSLLITLESILLTQKYQNQKSHHYIHTNLLSSY